jgi:hypothetical protein
MLQEWALIKREADSRVMRPPVEVSFSVQGSTGKAVAGAELFLVVEELKESVPALRWVTNVDGRVGGLIIQDTAYTGIARWHGQHSRFSVKVPEAPRQPVLVTLCKPRAVKVKVLRAVVAGPTTLVLRPVLPRALEAAIGPISTQVEGSGLATVQLSSACQEFEYVIRAGSATWSGVGSIVPVSSEEDSAATMTIDLRGAREGR